MLMPLASDCAARSPARASHASLACARHRGWPATAVHPGPLPAVARPVCVQPMVEVGPQFVTSSVFGAGHVSLAPARTSLALRSSSEMAWGLKANPLPSNSQDDWGLISFLK